jgi:nicotinate-nucleotide adenylyltransferase
MPELSGRTGAVGILGGTFDPVHLAHLALARAALERLGLAQVVWIPAGRPWHRDSPGAAPADRLVMVRAAIADESRFVLDTAEADTAAPGYTVDTLARLRRQFGATRPLVLLMGADAFRELASWHRWREIFNLAHIAVATRPGFPLVEFAMPLAEEFNARRVTSADYFLQKPAGSIVTFELVAGTVSATEVRARIAAGDPDTTLSALLPAPVLDYIRHNNLYRP